MRNIPGVVRGDWAAYIRATRESNPGLGTKQLAERAGVARATWWRWENGSQRPEKAEVAQRFAEGFDVPADEVMWAAGLAIEDTGGNDAARPDPLLAGLGLSPDDPIVQHILGLDISDQRKEWMLNRRRKILEDRRRADLEEVQFLAEVEREQLSGDHRAA